MSSLDEKRVYGAKGERVEAYLATGSGVAVVEIAGDRVGRFRLAKRCTARDVAAAGDRVVAATDEDVLVRDGPASGRRDDGAGNDDGAERPGRRDGFAGLDFGPAVAVGVDDGVLAAGPDGRVARYREGAWTTVGRVGEVRAIDGDLVAAADGVYRAGDGLQGVGLSDVRDVSAAGVPLAATGEGLYWLGNGWMDALGGAFRTVAADPGTARPGRLGRAHAATDERLYARPPSEGAGGDGIDWSAVDLPTAEPVAGVDYGPGAVYAATVDGTVLADDGDGWRTRSLGLAGVAAVAVR